MNDMFQELNARFIDSAVDKLDSLDGIIDHIYNEKGNRGDLYKQFVQEVHSLKGSAGTFGFALVSIIAHRLEDYLESSPRLEQQQWLDVQKFIDAIRDIFDKGADPAQNKHDAIIENLPSSTQNETNKNTTAILLVMKAGVIRKHLGTELAEQGFNISFANSALEAIELAITMHPKIVISNQELPLINGLELANVLKNIEATKNIVFLLMTANEELLKDKKTLGLHSIIYKDKNLSQNIIKFCQNLRSKST